MRPTCGPVSAAGLHATCNNIRSILRERDGGHSCFVDIHIKLRANVVKSAKPLKSMLFSDF